MKKPVAVGVDIGGTFVKVGLVRGMRIARQDSFPTKHFSARQQLLDAVSAAVRSIIRQTTSPVVGVGVGIPGLVQYPQGVVRSVVNLKGDWRGVPLRKILTRRLKLPVRVDNDVNLMTLAEWTVGAGRGVDNLICLTLGTGVGGGLVLGGSLYRGCFAAAGEIGHVPLSTTGPRCPCGGRGCLERYVGNKEVITWVRRQLALGVKSKIQSLIGHNPQRLTPEVIDRACALGDSLARQTWRQVGERVGLVLVGAVNLLAPERIVVGGGISKAGRWLFEPMRATVRSRVMKELKGVQIVPARLGSSAGLLGAALLAQEGEEG